MFQVILWKKGWIFLGVCVFLGLVAWQVPHVISKADKLQLHPLTAVPEGIYHFVAWLNPNQVAFIYSEPQSRERWDDRRIGIFTISSSSWQEIALPALPDNCYPRVSGVSHVNRLPDGDLGFLQHCHGDAVSGSLYKWDKDTDTVHLIQRYAPPFLVRDYSFAPDMTQFIQEDGSGAGLNNTLYRVNMGGKYQTILQDFMRARAAAWSPDGQQIAFAGTAVGASTDQQGWAQLEASLMQPWDIYVMDADGENIHTLLPSAGSAYALKWSPTNQAMLAYAGDRDNQKGLWLLDVETGEVKNIWNQNSPYDWSPNGDQIILIEESSQGKETVTRPVIVDIVE